MISVCIRLICRLCTALHTKCCGAVHGICIVSSGTLSSPHSSVENGNAFEDDSDCHTGGQSKGMSRISFFESLS